MASIIKNQILKHLSKFAKNLSTNSINISTFKGEGELRNLELNEEVLTELLELPNWMKISHARVNYVSIKVQWRKLTSDPIVLTLDEVQVQMETCKELRRNTNQNEFSSYRSGSSYGFSDKVIDGMTVICKSIIVTFVTESFTTSINIQKILLCSKSPNWQAADLRMTRLKDLNQQHVLIFKELSWQNLKFETKSSIESMTPLRIILNQARCRMTVKKKLSDCSVVGCRLVLLMEHILWVFTDSSLLTVYHLIESLSGLIKQATQEAQKTKAARKLESNASYLIHPENTVATGPQTQKGGAEKDKFYGGYNQGSFPYADQASMHKYQIFKKFDVVETSYHFFSDKIELNFCDDSGSGRSSNPHLKNGATLQVWLSKIKIDYYPYHLASGDRSHWIRYQGGSPYEWTKQSLNNFKSSLLEFFHSDKMSHAPLSRASPHQEATTANDQKVFNVPTTQTPSGGSRKRSSSSSSSSADKENGPSQSFVLNQFKRLMSTCCVLTCNDVKVYQVTLSKKRSFLVEMIQSDKNRLSLPPDTNFLHMEFSSFYYPGGFNFPVPAPKIYTHISPVKVTFDPISLLWLNAFVCHLMDKTSQTAPVPPYMDIHTEILMSRVIIEPHMQSERRKGRPKFLQIQTSRLEISNVRSLDPTCPGSKSSLFTVLDHAQQGELFFASDFPSLEMDRQPVPTKFLSHAEGSDIIETTPLLVPSNASTNTQTIDGFRPDTLWTEPRDILFIYFELIWLEFLDKQDSKKTQIFVDSFPLHLWVYIRELSIQSHIQNQKLLKKNQSFDLKIGTNKSCKIPNRLKSQESVDMSPKSMATMKLAGLSFDNDSTKGIEREEASLHLLVYGPKAISVQISHLQFVFLMRLLDTFNEFSCFLSQDTKTILRKEESFLIAAMFPSVSASLIIPPVCATTGIPSKPNPDAIVDGLPNPSDTWQQDITLNSGMDDLASGDDPPTPSNIPSISPPPSLSEDKGVASAMPKSHSDGCLSQGPSSAINVEGRKTSNPPTVLSKSGESIHTQASNHQMTSTPKGHLGIPSPNIGQTHHFSFTNTSDDKNPLSFSGMKKGFTSGFTSFINTIESTVAKQDGNNDISDTSSIHSDVSNDSDNFILMNWENELETATLTGADCVFKVNDLHDVEAAEEVTEEPTSSEPSIASHTAPAAEIGVVSFQLEKCQIVIEGHGHNAVIKFICKRIGNEEIERISTQEFKTKLSLRRAAENDLTSKENIRTNACSIKLRLATTGQPHFLSEEFLHSPMGSIVLEDPLEEDSGATKKISSSKERPPSLRSISSIGSTMFSYEDPFLPSEKYLQGRYTCKLPVKILSHCDVSVANLSMELLNSSVNSLVELIEDEILPPPLPTKILQTLLYGAVSNRFVPMTTGQSETLRWKTTSEKN